MGKLWSRIVEVTFGHPMERSSVRDEGESPPSENANPVLAVLEERARERDLRFAFFNPEIVNDACWAILQELYRAAALKHELTYEKLAAHTGLPFSTLERYLAHLRQNGLVAGQNAWDGLYPRLTAKGLHRMRDYFSAVVLQRHDSTINNSAMIAPRRGDRSVELGADFGGDKP